MRRRPLRTFVAVCALLLAIMPAAPSHHQQEAPVAADNVVDLAPVRQDDGAALAAVDQWYAFQAARTTTTTTTTTVPARLPQPSTEEYEHLAHFDPGSVQQLIVDHFGSAAPSALKVAKCESGYDPNAVYGRYRGVFQIGDMHAADWLAVIGVSYWDSWMDPVANVTYARALYERSGWGPWECAA